MRRQLTSADYWRSSDRGSAASTFLQLLAFIIPKQPLLHTQVSLCPSSCSPREVPPRKGHALVLLVPADLVVMLQALGVPGWMGGLTMSQPGVRHTSLGGGADVELLCADSGRDRGFPAHHG